MNNSLEKYIEKYNKDNFTQEEMIIGSEEDLLLVEQSDEESQLIIQKQIDFIEANDND